MKFKIIILFACLSVASCGEVRPLQGETELSVTSIPISIGDHRDDVLRLMGKPSSALDKNGYAEIMRDGPIFTPPPTKDDPNPQAQPLDAEHEKKFDSNPEVATSKVWRYYGHGDRDQYAAIYFKEDRVIGVAHGMTQEMVRSDLFK